MEPLILTAGLEASSAEKISGCFSPPRYKALHRMELDGVLEQIRDRRPAAVIFAVQSHTLENGLSLVREIRSWDKQLPIILINKHSSEDRAIAAMRAGVSDYFKEPFACRALSESVANLLQLSDGPAMGQFMPPAQARQQPTTMTGNSQAMRSILHYLANVAATDSTVLITGETGTGKELAADFIHHHSPRAGRPMVMVNCAALPESLAESELFGYERGAFTGAVAKQPGKFAQANGGTLFLDEIGDMRPFMQAKILHAIERKMVYPLGGDKALPIDARIIAATNQELETLMVDGRFREDLYYRLNIARVAMPPLRERKEDIPDLLAHGIERLNRKFGRDVKGLTPQAMACLMSYDWPGNVRELMNLLEASFINLPREQIEYADLPTHFKQNLKESQGRSAQERRRIVETLMKTDWNKSHAAQKLQWSRMTLYRKMAHYKIVERRTSAQPASAQPD